MSASSPPPSGERCRAKRDGEGEKTSRSRRTPQTKQRIKALRNSGNQAEALLWTELKAKRLNGYKFVRQHPIGPYFADFVCRKEKLVIELDGSQHVNSREYDKRRDAFMIDKGYSILRFWSVDVLRDRPALLAIIVEVLEGRMNNNIDAPDMRFKYALKRSLHDL